MDLKRYLEILIPVPQIKQVGKAVSNEFRKYYQSVSHARNKLSTYLASSGEHPFFVSGAEPINTIDDEDDVDG